MSGLETTSLVRSKEDWTFLDISTHDYTHGFHLYPARMHPEIAKRWAAEGYKVKGLPDKVKRKRSGISNLKRKK